MGRALLVTDGGFSRACSSCGAQHFPRTDPAVIVLVEHDGCALLGRQTGWPKGQYSVLAGFVGPGESLEEAVIREVKEESGITAHDPRFVGSQPWPFPMSVMLGFEARSEGGEPVPRDGELEDVRWFTRDEIGAALSGRSSALVMTPGISISYFLIERWFARGGRSPAAEAFGVNSPLASIAVGCISRLGDNSRIAPVLSHAARTASIGSAVKRAGCTLSPDRACETIVAVKALPRS